MFLRRARQHEGPQCNSCRAAVSSGQTCGAWKLPPTLPFWLLQAPTGNPICASCGSASLGPSRCAVQLPQGPGLQVSPSASPAVCTPGLWLLAPCQSQLWSAYPGGPAGSGLPHAPTTGQGRGARRQRISTKALHGWVFYEVLGAFPLHTSHQAGIVAQAGPPRRV